MSREQRKLSVFNRIVLWIHYFVILSLLLSIFAKYISPILFWLPAFFGLAFPFLFLINFIFILYWIVQFKPAFIFGLIALCVGIPTAYRYLQFSITDTESETKQLKITTYNSMLFDLYNWSKNRETRAKILNDLTEINPDILCLQEFYTSEEPGDYNNIDTIKHILKSEYYHSEYTITLRKYDHWGIATFSKYPIIKKGKIIFNTKSNNICIYSDIVVNRDTIRVYNVHLQSVSFSKKDNKFLEDVISEKKDAEDEVENSKSILRRLKRAFLKRSMQVDMILLHMKSCKYKVVLCGDFNETAASYSYQELSANLNDAFIEKGFGFGRTYAGKWPKFRIDYILHDRRLHCNRYRSSDETFTDHYPITAHFDNINWAKSADTLSVPR
jgi:endonuclease/exonuclease/phosphatase family metal-dependent hydrolase